MTPPPRRLGGVSILDLTLLPIRIARHIAEAVLHPAAPAPAPPGELVVVDGMPEGVPPAARRPSRDYPHRRIGRSARNFHAPAARAGWPVYPLEDHIAWVFQDKFEDPIAHMGTGLRQADPGHITFAWYPQLVRADLGIGPHQVWWLSELTADPGLTARRGAVAEVDARSYARPDPTHTVRHHRGLVLNFEPTPGVYSELDWRVGAPVAPLPYLTLRLTGVAGLTVDVARAGLAALPSSTITVATDTAAQITLGGLPAGVEVQVDGEPAGPTVAVSPGRHRNALRVGG
jgi:hypothetical protein